MATVIRPEISIKNEHYISKHRYYELKHLCLQYSDWKKTYADYSELYASSAMFERQRGQLAHTDITSRYAIKKAEIKEKIDLIERIAREADPDLHRYILKAVTEGLSYTYLKTKLDIPCGRDMYYARYRRFFWLLNEARG